MAGKYELNGLVGSHFLLFMHGCWLDLLMLIRAMSILT